MISLMMYLLDQINFCKIENLITYSLFFGVILYILGYLYMILYNQEMLSSLSWWMISFVLIDVAISILYYFSLDSKNKPKDFKTIVDDTDEITLVDEEIEQEQEEQKQEQDAKENFISNEYEKNMINEIVADAQELGDTPEMSMLKEIEKEMHKEFEMQIEDVEKTKKTKKKKKQEVKSVQEIDNLTL
jgi:uncharacterized membrane protein YfhO